jgi:hypothetical protein
MRQKIRKWIPISLAVLAFPLTFGVSGAQEVIYSDCRKEVAAEIEKLNVKIGRAHV